MQKAVKPIRNKTMKMCDFLVKRELLLSVLVVAVLVIIGISLAWENNKVVPINSDIYSHYRLEPNKSLSFMSNWDGPQYIQIAREGYQNKDVTEFFPLYPVLTRAADSVTSSYLYSALLISWVSLVFAVYFYIKIIKLYFKVNSNLEALRGVFFFLLFPSAVVLLATYTEALFAALSLGAIYFALKKRYLPAAIFTMFATATHINGVFVLILVALLLLEAREKLSRVILTIVIGSLGLLSYMSYLWVHYKNPLEFLVGQKANGWLHNGYLHHLTSTFSALDLIGLVLIALSVVYWWNRKKSFAVYSFLYLCIPIVGGQFTGFDRYALMAFPFQLMLYERFRNRQFAYTVCIILFSVFWCYFLLQYAGGYSGAGG